MRWRIATVGGTTVLIHSSLPVMMLYMLATGYGKTMLVGLLSIILHECAHAAAAAKAGHAPDQIVLTPLGAMMCLQDESIPGVLRRLAIILAGPAMTLALCFAALWGTKNGVLSVSLGRCVFLSNLAILAVNLLPALPLDGGRLLALGLTACLGSRKTVRIMRATGTALGMGCIAANLALSYRTGGLNLSLAAAGCLLMYGAHACTVSRALTELRMLTDRKIRLESRGAMPCRMVAVTDRTTLRQAINRMHPRCITLFCLMETGSHRLMGLMSEQAVIAAYLSQPFAILGQISMNTAEEFPPEGKDS